MLRITQENPHDVVAAALIAELTAELAALYSNEDGSGGFKPEDALVPRSAFVVAWWNDAPVGCGAIRPMEDDQIAEVKRMYTRPTLRGKGIARQILATLEDLARDFGYRALRLETGFLQPEAIRLYEKAGYSRIPCFGKYTEEDGSVCFAKEIEPISDEQVELTFEEAKQLLLYHTGASGMDVNDPCWDLGFLPSLRTYRGKLNYKAYREVRQALKVIAPALRKDKIDRELISALWGLVYLGWLWGVHSRGMLQRNKLISKEDTETLEDWLEDIGMQINILLDEGNTGVDLS